MNPIWFLVVFPVVVFFYVASAVVRGKKTDLTPCVTPLPKLSPFELSTNPGTKYESQRSIKLISAREVDGLAERTDDFIYIKVGGSGCWEPRTGRGVYVLHVPESELFAELRWIPAQTSIILYGVSDLSKALIWSGRKISGVAPVYIVTSDLFTWSSLDVHQ